MEVEIGSVLESYAHFAFSNAPAHGYPDAGTLSPAGISGDKAGYVYARIIKHWSYLLNEQSPVRLNRF